MSQRLDVFLVESGQVKSRSLAQKLIRAGRVLVMQSGIERVVQTPAYIVCPESKIHVLELQEFNSFVSRGGEKLAYALTAFELDLTGWSVLDVGQSTGGFTDCCLQRGAVTVTGIDVGHGQLAQTIRQDKRVTAFEKVHIDQLNTHPFFVGKIFDLAVCDLSFISWPRYWEKVLPFARKIIFLIKPQFELGKAALDKRGVVKDPSTFENLKMTITLLLRGRGIHNPRWAESPILGGSGNQEFFLFIDQDAL